MQIQVNTDNHIENNDRLETYLKDEISNSLHRFFDHLTRIEVHIGDENSKKGGNADKKCLLEARLKNIAPIVVTEHAETIQQAVTGAIHKLDHKLSAKISKLKAH